MNTVHNMDCMDGMKEYPDKFFDLAVVDPPYGIGINKSGRLGKYGGKKNWDEISIDEEYFKELFRISANAIIWGGNYFDLPPCKCFLIWDKRQPQALSFAMCEFAWTSLDGSAKIFYQQPKSLNRIHPTQKPIKLYDWIFTNYAKAEMKIIDTHVGSGSSRIAADKHGLYFVGYELDRDYWLAQEKRYAEYKMQLKLF